MSETGPIQTVDQYIHKDYHVEVEIDQQEGSTKGATIRLDRTFVLTGIQHQIVKDATGNPPVQDGAYKIDWSEQGTRRFWKGAKPAADQWGSVRHGIWRKLEAPIQFTEAVILEVEVINSVNRPGPFTVQVTFVGAEPVEK